MDSLKRPYGSSLSRLDPTVGVGSNFPQIPGASFLTNAEDILITLPYFQNCKKRKDVPILMVLEKGSVYYKKCQKDNVIIGSLVGRPLAWVQHDDENTAFRQCMARIR